jgi:hypothetical protein
MVKSISKSLDKLRNRLSMVKAHMDIVDVALISLEKVADNSKSTGKPLFEALGLPKSYEKRIKLKANNYRQITNHAKARNAELVIQVLYTHFTEYLRSILREMYDHKPLEIVDKCKGKDAGSIKFHEIVKLGSYDAICDYMVDQVFRSLENQRSTQVLLEKILDKTDVTPDPSILRPAMMYMEMRHLYVHNSGVIDENFERTFSDLLPSKTGTKFNSSIGLSLKAIKAIENLCAEIDQGLIEKGYLNPTYQKSSKIEPEILSEINLPMLSDESSLIS